MLCPLPCDGGRLTDPTARKAPRVAYGASAAICEPMREKFYVRSRCEGYLAVDQRKDRKNKRIKNKVILQRVGINDTHPLGKVFLFVSPRGVLNFFSFRRFFFLILIDFVLVCNRLFKFVFVFSWPRGFSLQNNAF